MNNIIVTGGAGFIGSNFIKKNIGRYNIINIDCLTYASNIEYLKDISNLKNYKFFKLNILDIKKVSKIIEKFKPKYLFNFAAESHVDNSIKKSDNFIYTNILGTHSLLMAVLNNKSKLNNKFKFIQISTDEVFGDIKKNRFSKETDKYNPSSPYSSSKASADHLVTSWGRTYGINYNITYSSNNFGPNQNFEKFIPVIINRVIQNKKIPIYGDGMQKRNWIYVDDNTNGIIKVAKYGKINNAYNIGSNNSLTNIELVKKIMNILIKKFKYEKKIYNLIDFTTDRLGHDRNYSLNSSKLKKLNWKCNHSFDLALEKTIKWYLDKYK